MADIPLDPRLQAQLLDLYRMSGDRIASTQPVHDAAMAMATRLAPGYARAAMRPAPTPSAPLTTGNLGQTGAMSPAAKAALAALASALANGGAGASGDVGKLLKSIIDHFKGNTPGNYPIVPGDAFGGPNTTTVGGRDPYGSNLPGYDEWGYYNDPNIFNGSPSDPSGGTGTGPGMQGFRNDPPVPEQGGGSSDSTNWWDNNMNWWDY